MSANSLTAHWRKARAQLLVRRARSVVSHQRKLAAMPITEQTAVSINGHHPRHKRYRAPLVDMSGLEAMLQQTVEQPLESLHAEESVLPADVTEFLQELHRSMEVKERGLIETENPLTYLKSVHRRIAPQLRSFFLRPLFVKQSPPKGESQLSMGFDTLGESAPSETSVSVFAPSTAVSSPDLQSEEAQAPVVSIDHRGLETLTKSLTEVLRSYHRLLGLFQRWSKAFSRVSDHAKEEVAAENALLAAPPTADLPPVLPADDTQLELATTKAVEALEARASALEAEMTEKSGELAAQTPAQRSVSPEESLAPVTVSSQQQSSEEQPSVSVQSAEMETTSLGSPMAAASTVESISPIAEREDDSSALAMATEPEAESVPAAASPLIADRTEAEPVAPVLAPVEEMSVSIEEVTHSAAVMQTTTESAASSSSETVVLDSPEYFEPTTEESSPVTSSMADVSTHLPSPFQSDELPSAMPANVVAAPELGSTLVPIIVQGAPTEKSASPGLLSHFFGSGAAQSSVSSVPQGSPELSSASMTEQVQSLAVSQPSAPVAGPVSQDFFTNESPFQPRRLGFRDLLGMFRPAPKVSAPVQSAPAETELSPALPPVITRPESGLHGFLSRSLPTLFAPRSAPSAITAATALSQDTQETTAASSMLNQPMPILFPPTDDQGSLVQEGGDMERPSRQSVSPLQRMFGRIFPSFFGDTGETVTASASEEVPILAMYDSSNRRRSPLLSASSESADEVAALVTTTEKKNVGQMLMPAHLSAETGPTALDEAVTGIRQTSNLPKNRVLVEVERVKPEAPHMTMPSRRHASKNKGSGFHQFLDSLKYIGLGKERALIIQNLATMMNAGLPLIDSLHTLQKEVRQKPMKQMLQQVVDAVENGSALWRALEAQNFFSPTAISLIRIGEEAGNLAENLEHLAHQQDKDAALQGKIKMAMIYPSIVMVLMFIVVMGLGLFVLPNLIGVLFSLNVKLPLVTQLLILFTKGFTKYAPVVVPSLLVGGFALAMLAKFTRFKVVVQWFMFHIPGIGSLAKEATISQFGVILGSLLEAGVPLIEALSSLAEVTSIVAYQNFYFKLLDHINVGDSFGKSFELIPGSTRLLPISVQQLVMTGERSGSLSKIMMKVSDIYEKKANDTAEKLPVILEPMMLLFIGGLVGTIALAIIVPIYSVVGSIGKQ